MIDMDAAGALRLRDSDLRLTWLRDIEEFDGPLVSEFRSATGEIFLYVWCDADDSRSRWLVVRTPYQVLFRYYVGRIALRNVILDCKDQFVYVLDLDGAANPLGSWYVRVRDLPEEYWPGEESFHPREEVIAAGFQDVYVGEVLGAAEAASTYPRRYLQTYAFHVAFGRGGNSRSMPHIRYRLTTGYVFNTLYKYMINSAPKDLRAKLESVAVASPGYVRFAVDPQIAAGIRFSLAEYLEKRASLDEAITQVARWASDRPPKHRTRNTDTRRRPKKDQPALTEGIAKQIIIDVCAQLGLDGPGLLERTVETKRAAKVLSSYRGRMRFLADREVKEEAMLVGLTGQSRR